MFNKRMEIVTFSSLKHLACGFSSIQFFPLLLTSSTALETLPLCTSFLPFLGGREDPLGLCCSPGPPAAWGAQALAREKPSLTW